MLLATDLDGTFLAGDAEARQQLYRLIARHPDIRLAYVSGRGLESVLPLLADPQLPQPDYIVCDVGATVVDGHTLQPVQPLQNQLDALWPGEQAVTTALAPFAGLHRQATPQQRRCSYVCDAGAISEAVHDAVAALECELLYSGGRFLDVLSRGVNKGSSLARLVGLIGIAPEQVLVAGDSLNDLSMFQQGYKGVCVGGSESSLVKRTTALPNVLQAGETGCRGILVALEHFGLVGPGGIELETDPLRESGASELVMVYHRLPYEEAQVDGKTVRRRHTSPNGIIPTLMSFFGDGRSKKRRGTWVAWSVHDGKKNSTFETHTPVDVERYPNVVAARVPLSKSDVDIFYKTFSKEAFWPLLHTFWERARFREDHWQVFLRVNRAFAQTTAAEAAPGAVVWIHDYNLWMVPAYLRELRPDVKIAFFHHTYFPSADVFNVVPWRRQIIGSLLMCDYVAFHIPRQVENFVDVARGVAPLKVLERENCAPRFLTYGCAMGLGEMTRAVEVHGRTVRLGAHPVGLDVDRIRDLLKTEGVRKRMAELRRDIGKMRLILSVERLDYTKGTLERLQAYERLLSENPELLGQITLVCICVPAAKEMKIYATLQSQIEQAVGRINGRFAQVGWTPLQFFFRSLPFEEVVPYYAIADLAWVTPLRDGLNLVAKEFVATQGLVGGRGVLVLSEFAGAAAELKDAVLCNPHDPVDLANACYLGISMGHTEARSRLRTMFEIVCYYDIRYWGRHFLSEVTGVPMEPSGPANLEPVLSLTKMPEPELS